MSTGKKTTSSNRHAELDHTGKQDFQTINQTPTNAPLLLPLTEKSPGKKQLRTHHIKKLFHSRTPTKNAHPSVKQ